MPPAAETEPTLPPLPAQAGTGQAVPESNACHTEEDWDLPAEARTGRQDHSCLTHARADVPLAVFPPLSPQLLLNLGRPPLLRLHLSQQPQLPLLPPRLVLPRRAVAQISV